MLRKFYKIPMLFSLLLLFVSIPVYAAKEAKSTIPVTYSVSEDCRYDLNVKVRGDGTVYDSSKSIRNGSIVHRLKVSEEKEFRIIPDNGSKLKNISWKDGDKDLSKYYNIGDINNGKIISLRGIATDSELIIEFEEKKDISSNLDQDQNDFDIKDDGEKSPQTGDKGMLGWVILFILSLTMILIYGTTYRRNQK